MSPLNKPRVVNLYDVNLNMTTSLIIKSCHVCDVYVETFYRCVMVEGFTVEREGATGGVRVGDSVCERERYRV